MDSNLDTIQLCVPTTITEKVNENLHLEQTHQKVSPIQSVKRVKAYESSCQPFSTWKKLNGI